MIDIIGKNIIQATLLDGVNKTGMLLLVLFCKKHRTQMLHNAALTTSIFHLLHPVTQLQLITHQKFIKVLLFISTHIQKKRSYWRTLLLLVANLQEDERCWLVCIKLAGLNETCHTSISNWLCHSSQKQQNLLSEQIRYKHIR